MSIPLPKEWDKTIPPQMVMTETVESLSEGYVITHPVWNHEWLAGLESFVRSVVRDERDNIVSVGTDEFIHTRYAELVQTVVRKFPGETRHQTALRYIREAEAIASVNQAVQEPE